MDDINSKQIDNRFNEMLSRIISYHASRRPGVNSDVNYIKNFLDFSINYNIENKIEYLTLTLDEFRTLKKAYYDILNKCKISIFMQNINDISVSELEELKKSFNVQYIYVKDLSYFDDSSQISIDLIYKYKKSIKKMADGIDDNYYKNQEDREKIIFGVLISRILENTEYDLDIQEEYKKRNKIRKMNYNNPSNEMLGLIKGKCVCRGYAGIVRDVFGYIGIDAPVIVGMSENDGHAWNQIKLDGEWYNIDVTWDRENIFREGKSYWLLKDDYRFEMGYLIKDGDNVRELSHRMYSINRTPGITCKKSLSDEELSKYLNFSDLRKKKWLTSTLKNINLGQIRLNVTKLFSDINNTKSHDSGNKKR